MNLFNIIAKLLVSCPGSDSHIQMNYITYCRTNSWQATSKGVGPTELAAYK